MAAETADAFYDHIADCLTQPEFRPRALFERFNIEVIATTESPLDDLRWHRMIRDIRLVGAGGHRLSPRCRGRPRVSRALPSTSHCLARSPAKIARPGNGYLAAHRKRRAYFISFGATSSDHGHPTARTENLSQAEAAALFDRVKGGQATPAEAEAFRGQMLTEMARMSLEDGLVLQIHPGSVRNHHGATLARFGRDKGYRYPHAHRLRRAICARCWRLLAPIRACR